jgi:putative NADPH-quinone reductase
MTATRIKEERKHGRISLEENDGVYCIVFRPLSAGITVSLPAIDFSESGFRFAVVPHMAKDFFEGEKIFLKAIAGSRNLTFRDPLKLEIKWRKHDTSRTWVIIGCEIVAISAQAKVQFVKFVDAEEKFRGVGRYSRLNGGPSKRDAVPEKDELNNDLQNPSKTILTVSGGSPQDGSLETVLHWIEDELRASGHHVERINLFAKALKGWDGSGHCNDPIDGSGFNQTDDAQLIIDKLVASDVVIYASPIYYWGFSCHLRALIDQCHWRFRWRVGEPKDASHIKEQRQALVVTTTEPFFNNAEPLLTIFHRMLGRFKAQSAGVLFVCNCSSPDALGEDIKNQSIKFAKNLFGSNRTPYPILIPGGERTGQSERKKEAFIRKGGSRSRDSLSERFPVIEERFGGSIRALHDCE